MTITTRLGAIAVLLAGSASSFADLSSMPSGTYGLDKNHAYITITYSHLGFSHPSIGFGDFDAELELDSAHPEESDLDVVIRSDSVDSGVAEFDTHLKGEEFFHANQYPEITFSATDIEMTGPSTGRVTGDLTIRGITRPVTLDVTLNKAAQHPMLKVPTLGLDAHATVSRSAWGMTRAVPFVSDDVDIHISVEMPRVE